MALPICEELISKLAAGVNIQLSSDYTFLLNFSSPATLNRSNASLINESLFAIDVNKLDQKWQISSILHIMLPTIMPYTCHQSK